MKYGVDISEGFKRDDFAIGNIVAVDVEGFDGQYIIIGNQDPALLTLREITAQSGRGKLFKMGRTRVHVTHLSIPVDLVAVCE